MQVLKPIQPGPTHRTNILLIIFSSIGILGLLVRGTYLTLTGINYFDPADVTSLGASVLEATAMLFCAGLLLPMLVYSIKGLKGKIIPPANSRSIKFWHVAVLLAAWVLVVILGAVINSLFTYGWAIAAPFFLLGITLPILCLVWIAAGGLPGGSRRRVWSVFGFGMVGSTVVALLIEYLVIGIALAGVGFLALANPDLRNFIDQIKTQITNANSMDIQTLLTTLAPYITNPLIILSVLVFAAILTPMIEEAVKPAVIWLLGKRLRSTAEGFALGALCGAGFAMLEGLMSASGATQMWGFGLAGRAAASLMHITGSGILGWGIASAKLEKRYGRLALTYLISVSIHGLWNGSAIVAVYGALRMMTQNNQFDLPSIALMLVGLGTLFIELAIIITGLPLINRRLRQSVRPSFELLQSDIIAPLATSDIREADGLDS